MAMGRKVGRVPGSLRDIGMASLGVDKVTKSRLKRLAGDSSLVDKVRELVELGERLEGLGLDGSQLAIPGVESLVSHSTKATRSDVLSINASFMALLGVLKPIATALAEFHHDESSVSMSTVVMPLFDYLENVGQGGESIAEGA